MAKSVQLNTKQQQQSTHTDNSNNIAISSSSSSNNSKKKKKNKKKSKRSKSVENKTQTDMVDAMMNHHVQLDNSHRDTSSNKNKNKSSEKNKSKEDDTFWSSTNNTEERQKIREFWLQLGEEERRSLVKVEKEAVLRKMKEQQKHSCNCSVCGKKRTAIEDELEVLYDAYYEELEQYANHQQQTRESVNSLHAGYLSSDPMYDHTYDDTDPLDEDGEDEEDEDDEDYDDDDLDDDLDDEDDDEEDEEDDDDYDDADDDDDIMTRPPIASYGERSRFEEMAHIRHTALARASNNSDHFSFGNSLTVKGGILTVADDLLKNDGKKFLDMMERLAERRMQKEDNVSDQGNSYYQEEEDEDDDAYEDEDDEDTRTEEQRMEEGRRMFQIFAARMFEQRVLAAYREKVAQERQQRLLEELEEEDRLREEREAKKQQEREKKKDKKRQLKQQQEAERLAREAKKKAEEEAAKREKAKKIELERQKREQERLKREEEKRQKEEERLRREEERKRRAKEEKERAAEKERKRKEKEEKERLLKEKEEKERRERERLAREKEEKERLEKERLAKEQEEKERQEKEKARKALLEKEEKERLKREAAEAEAAAKILGMSSPTKVTTKTPSPPPGIAPKTETRQQTLIDALVGSSRPNNDKFMDTAPIRPPSHLQHSPFMPPMLQTSTSTSLLNNPSSPINDNPPSLMGMFNNRPLEPSASSRRSFAPISPIGQPIAGRRASSVPLGTLDDPLLAASNMIKRPSVTSPFDTNGTEPRSFFSNFLFGESRNNMIPEYDLRFPPQQQQQQSWTNGWTANSVLSENVHGKLFGDALTDRVTMTLERAKLAYQKLNDITQTSIFRGTQQYHTLIQLHCMMNDLYGDFPVDIRELYETLVSSPASGFQCVNHAQHGMIVLYDPSSPKSPSPPLPPPFSPSHPLFG